MVMITLHARQQERHVLNSLLDSVGEGEGGDDMGEWH